MDDRVDRDLESDRPNPTGEPRDMGQTRRFSVSPRLTYLLIGGAALGLIALMCLAVALIAIVQNS